MRFLFITLLLLLFTACSPKYVVKTHYTLPTDAQGKACVQTCSNEQKICQAHCNQKQDSCLVTAKQSVTDAFPALMHEYDYILNEYHYAMDRYNLEMDSWQREERRVHQDYEHYRSSCHGKPKNAYECRRAHELDGQLHSIESHQPIAPVRPVKPSLASEIKHAQKNCSNECGCTKSYDTCFAACGGKLDFKRICVANCKK